MKDFLCTTKVDENGETDIEVIHGVNSETIEQEDGQIRLEQAAMHLLYLSDISGFSPMELAGNIARVIENREIDIGTAVASEFRSVLHR